MRCNKTGRKCDGYTRPSNPSSPQRAPPTALPALPNFDNSRQRQCFAFFVSCTSNAANLYFGANFWARRVLQLSLSEPSIRYALCSLSALHQMSTVPALPFVDARATELGNYALQQYSHAVRCTQTLLAESSDRSADKLIKGLVACVLFVCYENFIGNYEISHMHLQNGLHIINKELLKRPSAIPKDIIQVFKRMDLQAISFGNSKAPYPEHLCNDPIELLTDVPISFNSIEDAIDVVLHIFRWMFRNMGSSESSPIPPEHFETALKVMEEWTSKTEHFSMIPMQEGELRRPVALLRMYQIIMDTTLATGVYGQESLNNEHLHKYEELIALGEKLVLDVKASSPTPSSNQFFCFDTGVIFPLFWVAIKCRDPRARRRAVHLLGSMHHQEGVWKSISAAKVAQFVIAIEEEGLPAEFSQYQIPETARVHLVQTKADVERGDIHLTCLLRSRPDNASWYTREGRVSSAAEFSPA